MEAVMGLEDMVAEFCSVVRMMLHNQRGNSSINNSKLWKDCPQNDWTCGWKVTGSETIA